MQLSTTLSQFNKKENKNTKGLYLTENNTSFTYLFVEENTKKTGSIN